MLQSKVFERLKYIKGDTIEDMDLKMEQKHNKKENFGN